MRLPDLRALRHSLEGHVGEQQVREVAAVNEVSRDTLKFLEMYCKLKPYWYLLELIASYEKFQFYAVRWPRQTGKALILGLCIL
jgi:hypothetical protein